MAGGKQWKGKVSLLSAAVCLFGKHKSKQEICGKQYNGKHEHDCKKGTLFVK
jgi:hypothetical protein